MTTRNQLHVGRVGRRRRIDVVGALAVIGALAMFVIGGTGDAPDGIAAPPPADRFAHGAAGTARNGFGGEIAPSPSSASWPGTANGGNGGPFAFIGAQYGSLWKIPAGPNNSLGVGYCVMEDVGGTGTVAPRPTPATWDAGERARAAALMATFGGDRVVPYGIDASGTYDVASGEWNQPSLFGGGEYTRRRHVAVGFGVKMFLEDVSPSGAAAGRKLARDTAVVRGSGSEFTALSNGYRMALRIADVAERQHAVGGVTLGMRWVVPAGEPPTSPGVYTVEVQATDATRKALGFVPILQLSDIGIDGHRSIATRAVADTSADDLDDTARRRAAVATRWPTWDMRTEMAGDPRFALAANPAGAAVTGTDGVARFHVTITSEHWELAFHTQAPTADVQLLAGTGIQGQVTWGHRPQSASLHEIAAPPPPPDTTTTTLPITTTTTTTIPATTTTISATTTTSTTTTTITLPETTLPTTTAVPITVAAPPPTSSSPPTTAPATTRPPSSTMPSPSPGPSPTLPRTGAADPVMQRRTVDAGVAMFLVGTALVVVARGTRRGEP